MLEKNFTVVLGFGGILVGAEEFDLHGRFFVSIAPIDTTMSTVVLELKLDPDADFGPPSRDLVLRCEGVTHCVIQRKAEAVGVAPERLTVGDICYAAESILLEPYLLDDALVREYEGNEAVGIRIIMDDDASMVTVLCGRVVAEGVGPVASVAGRGR